MICFAYPVVLCLGSGSLLSLLVYLPYCTHKLGTTVGREPAERRPVRDGASTGLVSANLDVAPILFFNALYWAVLAHSSCGAQTTVAAWLSPICSL